MAVREGFEPSIRFRIHTFQACSFSHSDTSPKLIVLRTLPVGCDQCRGRVGYPRVAGLARPRGSVGEGLYNLQSASRAR